MQLEAGVTTSIQSFLMAMVGLSVAAERVTEAIKQWMCPASGQPNAKGPSAATVQTIAIVSGILVTALSTLDPLNITKGAAFAWDKPIFWLSWVVTGILVSGGSAFWNHLLDILQATKVAKEQQAYGGAAAPVATVVAAVIAPEPQPVGAL
ncbi:MAG TPA: hypothetical protein VG225_12770 [Terracidiphilus sp.]|jgi:divalent metal cation (Fe/Co/Zn/Cd) transporter|nr:hypothetical protein [Terracidiphilus sp.]